VDLKHGARRVTWLDMGATPFHEPFFQQTVRRYRQKHDRALEIVTEPEALVIVQRLVESVPLGGFVFHMSRCGSSLVSNTLQTVDDTLVLAEADPLSYLLALPLGDPDPDSRERHEPLRSALVQALVRILTQRRLGNERVSFVKFSHEETVMLPWIRRLWPAIPWVFITRDPVEVVVSHLNVGAERLDVKADSKRAASLLDLPVAEVGDLSPEEFVARLLGRLCIVATECAGPGALFVDYEELSVATLERILAFFGLHPSASELAAIRRGLGFHAKDADRRRLFVPDAARKQSAASPFARAMADQWARAPYERARALAPALGSP
jgi:hypothetical protein